MEETRIRPAGPQDLPHILRHRRAMYADMGCDDAAALEGMLIASEPYFRGALADGTYRGWLAEVGGGCVVAGGGVSIIPWPPAPTQPEPRRAFVHNVYTEPAYRRRGIARQLMKTMLEWCRAEGFASAALHASDDGRALYAELGFHPTNEMRLYFS